MGKVALGVGAVVVVAGAAAYAATLAAAPTTITASPTTVTVTQPTTVVTTVTQPTTTVVTQPTTMVTTVTQPTTTLVTETTTVVTKEVVAPKTLNLNWNLGYYDAEKLATLQAVEAYEQATGNVVNISMIGTDEQRDKLIALVEAKQYPDLVFAMWSDVLLGPLWAYKGLLMELSDITAKFEDRYVPGTLKTVTYYNAVEQEWGIYGVPFHLHSEYFHVWTDLVEEAGMDIKDVPSDWDEFWGFFIEVQDRLREKGMEDVYAFGFNVGKVFDPKFLFEDLALAFNSRYIDEEGNLIFDQPGIREGLIEMVSFVKDLYDRGYVPPGATAWGDPDNNLAFHSKKTIVAINPTMSIPGYQFDTNKENYYERTATILKPKKPDGGDWPVIVRPGMFNIFKDAPDPELAKDFINFFMQDDYLFPFLRGHNGRFLPAFKDYLERDYYNNPDDPHVPMTAKYLTQYPLVPWPIVLNPAFSQVVAEDIHNRVWGRVLVEGASPESAIDEFISRVNTIFKQWRA
jgi:multiple sugar transport system substrate-binding protein